MEIIEPAINFIRINFAEEDEIAKDDQSLDMT
jgi:hypothetical protein